MILHAFSMTKLVPCTKRMRCLGVESILWLEVHHIVKIDSTGHENNTKGKVITTRHGNLDWLRNGVFGALLKENTLDLYIVLAY